MAYYIYKRVSTQSQVEKNGLQMQDDVTDKYCKEHGIEVSGIFHDDGISGTIIERPGIMDLLSVLQEGDRIIVQNTSRLWRDDNAKVMIRNQIKKAKADVISVEQPTYTCYKNDPNDYFINSMMELLDEYDKMMVVMKLYKGRKASARNGKKPCGRTPFGYRYENREIVSDLKEKQIVLELFQEALANGGNVNALARYCESKGYVTRQNKPFSRQTIKNILTNEFYIGKVIYGDRVSAGKHEIFISEPLFVAVNNMI